MAGKMKVPVRPVKKAPPPFMKKGKGAPVKPDAMPAFKAGGKVKKGC